VLDLLKAVYPGSATHFLGRSLLGGSVNRANLLFTLQIRTVINVTGGTGGSNSMARSPSPGVPGVNSRVLIIACCETKHQDR
jgi:hypothetical protein